MLAPVLTSKSSPFAVLFRGGCISVDNKVSKLAALLLNLGGDLVISRSYHKEITNACYRLLPRIRMEPTNQFSETMVNTEGRRAQSDLFRVTATDNAFLLKKYNRNSRKTSQNTLIHKRSKTLVTAALRKVAPSSSHVMSRAWCGLRTVCI